MAVANKTNCAWPSFPVRHGGLIWRCFMKHYTDINLFTPASLAVWIFSSASADSNSHHPGWQPGNSEKRFPLSTESGKSLKGCCKDNIYHCHVIMYFALLITWLITLKIKNCIYMNLMAEWTVNHWTIMWLIFKFQYKSLHEQLPHQGLIYQALLSQAVKNRNIFSLFLILCSTL